ncbi:MAG TPA: hypothetical protein VGD40_04915 [Chryseosolibacter sp.]
MSRLPLKRSISILLLSIFLFNVGGYYLAFIGLMHRSDKILEARIEANGIDSNELIEIKIPLTLPYPIQQKGFENIDGRFEHKGVFYKLIKHKFDQDTVYVVCVRDSDTRELTQAFEDYVAKTNDTPTNSKNTLTLFGKFLKDFQHVESDIVQSGNGWQSVIRFRNATFTLHNAVLTRHSPPPKA